MKKIIAIATLSLAVTACDPYEDESSASAILEAMVVPNTASTRHNPTSLPDDAVTGTIVDADGSDGWLVDAVLASDTPANPPGCGDPPAVECTYEPPTPGRAVVIKTNGLLDGSSIEAVPQGCVPAGGWLTVTTTATLDPAGTWYTCYYPGTPTALEGASVVIYYSTTAPGVGGAAIPRTAGRLTAGNYNFAGTIRAKNGSDLTIDVDVTTVIPPLP